MFGTPVNVCYHLDLVRHFYFIFGAICSTANYEISQSYNRKLSFSGKINKKLVKQTRLSRPAGDLII
jgi:hypothetical protein